MMEKLLLNYFSNARRFPKPCQQKHYRLVTKNPIHPIQIMAAIIQKHPS